jgi:hypothetical protein
MELAPLCQDYIGFGILMFVELPVFLKADTGRTEPEKVHFPF